MNLSWPWLILFYGWTASEIYIALATRTRRSGGEVKDRGSLWVLWFSIVASITGAEWIRQLKPALLRGPAWMSLAGVLVLAAGITLRWVAILSLGKAFSANVAIRPTQTIYKSGLFRFVRHPSYTGLLVIFLGIGLHARNWFAVGIMLVSPTLALLYRIHVEENALRGAFGQEYAEYSKVTSRLIPGLY